MVVRLNRLHGDTHMAQKVILNAPTIEPGTEPGTLLIRLPEPIAGELRELHQASSNLADNGASEDLIKAAEHKYDKAVAGLSERLLARIIRPGTDRMQADNQHLVALLRQLHAGLKGELIGGYQPENHPVLKGLFHELEEACAA